MGMSKRRTHVRRTILPDIAARSAPASGGRRTPDTAPEPVLESPHPHAPAQADGDAFRSGCPVCGLEIADDSCPSLAKTGPPDAGPPAVHPPTPFAGAQSLPAAGHFRSLDAAYPAAPDPVAQELAVAPAPVP
jgi:hypothetical protein